MNEKITAKKMTMVLCILYKTIEMIQYENEL